MGGGVEHTVHPSLSLAGAYESDSSAKKKDKKSPPQRPARRYRGRFSTCSVLAGAARRQSLVLPPGEAAPRARGRRFRVGGSR